MRRVWGSVVLGLGVFLLVTAAMTRFYVVDQLLITPKDQYAQTIAPGTGTYFDAGALSEKRSDLVARRTLRGDVAASNDTVGVWDVSVVLETSAGAFVRATIDRVAFDRKTAQSVHCCGESVDSEPTAHDGVSYKFPFGTKKEMYQFWDVNSRKSYPARYVTEETIQGLTVYKFIQEIAGQQLRTQEVPGTLVGESSPTFPAPVWYQNTRTVWVEPRTGVIVKGVEQTKTTLRDSAGQDRVVVLDATLTFDEASQQQQADLARDGLGRLRVISWIAPLVALILGLAFFAVGLMLLRAGERPSPGRGRPAPEREPEPVGGPAT
jgi:hypothetical protein